MRTRLRWVWGITSLREAAMETILKIVTVIVGAVVIGVFAMMAYGFHTESSRPTFELKKDDWVCTATHKQQYVMLVGKVMVPQWRNVCDIWERK